MKVIIRGDYLQQSVTKKSLPGFLCSFASDESAFREQWIKLLQPFQLPVYLCNNRIQRKRYDILLPHRNWNRMIFGREPPCHESCAYLFLFSSVCA